MIHFDARWLLLACALGVLACGGSDDETAKPKPSKGLAIQCNDSIDSLYQAAQGLEPFSAESRGEIVGCAPYASYTEAEVASRLSEVPGVVIASGGVDVYLIAYRTAREPADVEGLSTALVYVPEKLMEAKVPMVLATHGTVGLADRCAPSHLLDNGESEFPPWYFDSLYLTWAARGMPVVAPDYAGLGTPGVHDYSNWFDPARSAVDGLRAMRSILPASELDQSFLIEGHSQGGGVALTAEAIASEVPDLTLGAVVATTPSWRLPTSVVDVLSLSSLTLTPILRGAAVYTAYGALANLTDDETQFGAAFKANVRAPLVERVSTLCFLKALVDLDTPAAGYVPPPTLGDLLDPGFVQQVTACNTGGDCTTLGGKFVARDNADEPHLSASSPPTLITASIDDEQLTPGQIGCVVDRVEKDGAPFELCVHNGQHHLEMVPTLGAYSVEWALAAARGTQRPACTGTEARPACVVF